MKGAQCVCQRGGAGVHKQEQRGRQGWVLWVFASFASPNKGRSQMPRPELGAAKPNISPEDRNAFVISTSVNYVETESGPICSGHVNHVP